MTTNTINTVSLDETASLIAACPDTRFFLMGEPGIGKSSILKTLNQRLGDGYAYAYFDCAQKDLGDIAMPYLNRETRQTEYFPNAALQLSTGKPLVLMLDEFSKAPQPVQNMLHPLLEAHNPRLGDVPLPQGSIIILTGNMAGDGVGDTLKSHTLNRVTTLVVRKPTADEWLVWATDANISPVVQAWVKQFPHALASYMDGDQDANPYIFNPKKVQTAYVTPRSLYLVSNIIEKREQFTSNALLAAMTGTIGAAAAYDMHAFVEYQDQLPEWDDIITRPESARLPDTAGACMVAIFNGVMRVEKDTIGAFMRYIERMEPEFQAIFVAHMAKNQQKNAIAFTSAKFRDLCVANVDIL